DESKMPEGMTKKSFIKLVSGVMGSDSKKALANFSWKMMLVAGMHFQDSYNYDIERVRRCGVHYITPDCRLYPFCAYNSGPEFRREIEAKFSIPLEEWKKLHKEEADKIDAALIVPIDERGPE
ncbi:MAG: radical SAM protein, partial [Candidatus Methanomethylophilaceae archaeon]|nr:radical SAM protein [Candidatus Methanomethylophilaceae archaeon]